MSKSLRLVVLFLINWATFTGTASAAQVNDLYRSQLLVPQQTGQPSAAQARDGLSQVLIKVAGNQKVLSFPAVLNHLKNSANALTSFGYQDAQRAISGAGGAQQPASLLSMEFAPSVVNRIIADAGVRPMGSIRPSVLIWVAKQEAGRRDYASPEGDVYNALSFSAAKRGLPLRAPLLDLTDQSNLSVGDLWGQFDGIIATASERYRTEAVLSIRLNSFRGQWQLDWSLINGDQRSSGSHKGALDAVSEAVVNSVADTLFQSLTTAPATTPASTVSASLPTQQQQVVSSTVVQDLSGGTQLLVSGISDVTHMIELEDGLRNMPVIQSVIVNEMRGTQVSYKLRLNGPLAQVRSALALLPRLRELPAVVVNGEAKSDLSYSWQ